MYGNGHFFWTFSMGDTIKMAQLNARDLRLGTSMGTLFLGKPFGERKWDQLGLK